MTEAELQAEIVACEACKCRPCAIRKHDAEEQLAFLANQPKPEPTEDLSGFDPVLLAVGIKMPKAKLKRVLEPAERKALGERFSKMLARQNSIRSITARQERFDRLHGLRGVVVRG